MLRSGSSCPSGSVSGASSASVRARQIPKIVDPIKSSSWMRRPILIDRTQLLALVFIVVIVTFFVSTSFGPGTQQQEMAFGHGPNYHAQDDLAQNNVILNQLGSSENAPNHQLEALSDPDESNKDSADRDHEQNEVVLGVEVPEKFSFKCDDVPYHAQNNEDQWIHEEWLRKHFKFGGIIVEIGALDGDKMSTSYWVEKCMNWRAILVEGHPVNAKRCSDYRGHCVHSALCEEVDGTTEFLDGGGSAGDPKLLAPAIRNKWHPDFATETRHKVPCNPFWKILENEGVTGAVDIWTLDVEGAEEMAIKTWDWHKHPVHVLIVEVAHSRAIGRQRDALLNEKCMKHLGNKLVHGSDVYINENYPNPACSNK